MSFLYESSPGANPALIPLIHTDNWQMHYWRFHPPCGSDLDPLKWHLMRGWNWTCQLPFTLLIISGRTFMFKNCLLLFSYYTSSYLCGKLWWDINRVCLSYDSHSDESMSSQAITMTKPIEPHMLPKGTKNMASDHDWSLPHQRRDLISRVIRTWLANW